MDYGGGVGVKGATGTVTPSEKPHSNMQTHFNTHTHGLCSNGRQQVALISFNLPQVFRKLKQASWTLTSSMWIETNKKKIQYVDKRVHFLILTNFIQLFLLFISHTSWDYFYEFRNIMLWKYHRKVQSPSEILYRYYGDTTKMKKIPLRALQLLISRQVTKAIFQWS